MEFQLIKGKVYVFIFGVVEREILQSGEIVLLGMLILQILNISKLKVVVDVLENLLCSVKFGEIVIIQFLVLDLE